jgi:hypothetical protein
MTTAPKIGLGAGLGRRTNPPSPHERRYRLAALEDDQYNERHHVTIVFSSYRVPQGGINDCRENDERSLA